jgi:hypothetical protein
MWSHQVLPNGRYSAIRGMPHTAVCGYFRSFLQPKDPEYTSRAARRRAEWTMALLLRMPNGDRECVSLYRRMLMWRIITFQLLTNPPARFARRSLHASSGRLDINDPPTAETVSKHDLCGDEVSTERGSVGLVAVYAGMPLRSEL